MATSRRGFVGLSLRSLAAVGLAFVPELRLPQRGDAADLTLEHLTASGVREALSHAPQTPGYAALSAFLEGRGFTRDASRDDAVRLRGESRSYVVARSGFAGAGAPHITTLQLDGAAGAVAIVNGDAFAARPDGSIAPAPSAPRRAAASGRVALSKPLAADCCALWADCVWYDEACISAGIICIWFPPFCPAAISICFTAAVKCAEANSCGPMC